jgi:hypothetical protein
MRDIGRWIRNVEKKLKLNEEPKTITIILFGGELQPDRKQGNITYHYVMYDKKVRQRKAKEGHVCSQEAN